MPINTSSSAWLWQGREASPEPQRLRDEVLSGLAKVPKALPSKLLYDERGSLLFDCLSTLPEYYPIRTEIEILEQYKREIAAVLGPDCVLIANGNGDNRKLLSGCQEEVRSHIPIDEHLWMLGGRSQVTTRQGLRVVPGYGEDTRRRSRLPCGSEAERRIIHLAGSTFGNLPPREARQLLEAAEELGGPKGGILIGVDLKKDVKTLEQAYNDRLGITAAFNLNILERLNRELDADFNLRWFQHRAFYDSKHGRTEMQLVSLRDQDVCIDGAGISLRAYETIQTAYYYQYALPDFARLAKASGVEVRSVWMDEQRLFSVQYLESARWLKARQLRGSARFDQTTKVEL